MKRLIITPKTKIFDLLEAYPHLEDMLIESAPEFRKLKNPVLRKTITRITNLSQAAVIAGLNVEDLVNKMRKGAGQDDIGHVDDTGTRYNTVRPEWYSEERVIRTVDIREMLNRGEQPVHEVMADLRKLKKDEIIEIIAPFIPAPLIDKSLSLEYKHWLDKRAEEDFRVFFAL